MTTPIHVIDFEGSPRSGVVEFGVVTLVGTGIGESTTRLCAPEGQISPVEQAQHGIHPDRAAREPPFAVEWTRFSELRRSGPFAAHSAQVEDGFLRRRWAFAGSVEDFGASAGAQTTEWGPWVDTLTLYRRYYPSLDSHKLADLVHRFRLQDTLSEWAAQRCPPERARYHCALYDALASALLLRHLLAQPGFSGISIRSLILDSLRSAGARNERGQGELF